MTNSDRKEVCEIVRAEMVRATSAAESVKAEFDAIRAELAAIEARIAEIAKGKGQRGGK